ncbi:MAG: hypothetical protein IJD76_03825 [Bacilli bacterium]|nr:hypothetical protein [Bacilli bacterium]
MNNFWDSNIWSLLLLTAVLFLSMLFSHALKNKIPFLNKSLMPASVLGGIIILVFTTIYKLITKEAFFDLEMFSITTKDGNIMAGTSILEIITYHALAIGFIAMSLKSNKKTQGKKRTAEVFNTGVTTVTTYLIQVILGLVITIIFAPQIKGMIEASGILLAFGYGQGTGQALNYGLKYQQNYGFTNGSNFGLAIAALGFLSASIGGVVCLNILKFRGKIKKETITQKEKLALNDYQGNNEIPVNASIDKSTIQIAIVLLVYVATYVVMKLLGNLVGDGLKSTIFGFNFLIGTLLAIFVKTVHKSLRKYNYVKRDHINDFMMNRISGIAFDVMIVAGVAAIDLENIRAYWHVLAIMGIVGAAATYAYIYIVSKFLFKDYQYEQFFAMYGMLTGTASTGVILLREIDPNFETPAADNLVYQNLPAIVLGFPIMLLADYAPQSRQAAFITLAIVVGLLAVLLVVLFRSKIFRRKAKN